MCCSAAVPPAPRREQDSLLSLLDFFMDPPPPGGNAKCGYFSAFVTADTAGNLWFGEPNSSVDPSTAEGRIGLKFMQLLHCVVKRK